MADLNKAMIIGRLGQDPKLNYTTGGKAVANLSVATSEKWKDAQTGQQQERTEWHRVTVWGPSAEFCGNYLGKGRMVYIEGKIQTRKWQDQQGQDRYTTEIVVQGPGSCVNALDRAPEQPQQQQQQCGYQQPTAPRQQGDSAFPTDANGMEDVPF